MIEISLNKIVKSFGANKILHNISFDVQKKERIGLIGRNGTGKTTIFKIISGLEDYDSGILTLRKGASTGYMDQIPDYPDKYKVIDVLNTTFEDVFAIREKLRDIESEMSKISENDVKKIIKEYGELQNLFENKGGYEIEVNLNKICSGLKLSEEFKNRKFNTLSGGEKTTVMLGKILLQNADILLLDEPTNHLDIESVEWLEDFLLEYIGTILIISHDRYFLDKIVNKIIEIEDGNSRVFYGNYSYYIKENDRMLFDQFEKYKDQQKKIKAMKESIKRFRDWGTRTDNPKMFKKAFSLEKRLEKMEKIDKPILERKKIGLNFSKSHRSGNDVIKVTGLKKSFQDNLILDDLDLFVRYQEKVAILGKNGTGKTTLMKVLTNLYKPDGGEVKIGSRVNIGYLEQEVYFDNQEFTVLETFRRNFNIHEGEARNKLAKFLFFGDEVYKKVMNISGGERVRLQLSIMLNQDINLLLLDEPSNHLDTDSREMFEQALQKFTGTVVFISHDRYLINKIAQRIVELRDKKFVNYLGNYDYYKQKKIKEKIVTVKEIPEMKPQKAKYEKDKKIQNEKKKVERRILEIEEKMEKMENQISEKDKEMEKWATDYKKLYELYKEKCGLRKNLDLLFEEWIQIKLQI